MASRFVLMTEAKRTDIVDGEFHFELKGFSGEVDIVTQNHAYGGRNGGKGYDDIVAFFPSRRCWWRGGHWFQGVRWWNTRRGRRDMVRSQCRFWERDRGEVMDSWNHGLWTANKEFGVMRRKKENVEVCGIYTVPLHPTPTHHPHNPTSSNKSAQTHAPNQ
jgi:hypothetical protein